MALWMQTIYLHILAGGLPDPGMKNAIYIQLLKQGRNFYSLGYTVYYIFIIASQLKSKIDV